VPLVDALHDQLERQSVDAEGDQDCERDADKGGYEAGQIAQDALDPGQKCADVESHVAARFCLWRLNVASGAMFTTVH